MFEWLRCDQKVQYLQCSFWNRNLASCRIWKDNVHNSPENWPITHENAEEIRLVRYVCILAVTNELCSLIPEPWILFLTGKIDNTGELTEKEIIRAERNSGVISNRVREIQVSIKMLKLQNCTP